MVGFGLLFFGFTLNSETQRKRRVEGDQGSEFSGARARGSISSDSVTECHSAKQPEAW